MESLVNDNLLFYNPKDHSICKKEYPKTAFDMVEYNTDFVSLFQGILDIDFSDFLEKEKFEELKIFMNTSFDINVPQFQKSDDPKQGKVKYSAPKESINVKEWFSSMGKFMDDLFNSKDAFKSLRRDVLKTMDFENIDISKPTFNEDLKQSTLGKTFIEFVQGNVNLQKKENSYKDFFVTAYLMLNVLGLDKEKNQKAQFKNTEVDAHHAFYAAHCDIIVSNEKQVLVKANALFKLLNIETKVLNLDEFKSLIKEEYYNKTDSISHLIGLLKNDILNHIVLKTQFDEETNTYSTVIEPKALYFNYFNRIQLNSDSTKSEINSVFFFKKPGVNYSNFLFYSEIIQIVNNIVSILGIDSRGLSIMIENDAEELKEGRWIGRYWVFDGFEIILEKVEKFQLMLEIIFRKDNLTGKQP
jgi:hypothetical protein